MENNEKFIDTLRHDTAHVLAMAVQELFPETQVTIGPVIENGFYYDFDRKDPFTDKDLGVIEKKMKEIVNRDEKTSFKIMNRDDAIKLFSDKGEKYKVEIIKDLPESEELKVYYHGDWFDLCKGPHLESTGQIGKAFKLTKVAGAYWRGDSNNPMLQRIYGTAWETEEQLKKYLILLEEAEKRDHRKLGKQLDLFHFQEEAPGSVFWHAKGWTLFSTLIDYMRRRQEEAGYEEINTPDIMDKSLWVKSGHLEKFGDNMFTTEARDDRVYALKPMNCPGGVQVYKQGLKSYRDLPLKIAEFGKVHRYEPSGALHGLMRVRAFTQDDAHIYCTEDQITEESKKVCDLVLSIYKDFGFEDVSIKFSDRPEKRVGNDEVWDKSEAALRDAMEATGLEYSLNPGEGAFYGPKLEFILKDAIGREWQCGTLQVDLNMPERLDAHYVGEDGQKYNPVMLHRALFGSLERFTGILIEHYAGALPLWLSPVQAIVTPITSEINEYGEEVYKSLKKAGIRVEKDLRNEKISYKIRENSLKKIPFQLILGKKEIEERSITMRVFGSDKQEKIKFENLNDFFIKKCMIPSQQQIQEIKIALQKKNNRYNQSTKGPKFRINEFITTSTVRLIDEKGNNLGVVNTDEAVKKAIEVGLDLVEVSPQVDPPVCKILDFGKFKYEAQKKASTSKKKQKEVTIKEIKMRPGIDVHDYDFKVRAAQKFITAGDKVKFTIRFKGREFEHHDIAENLMERIRETMGSTSKIEQEPKLEGRQFTMIFTPNQAIFSYSFQL